MTTIDFEYLSDQFDDSSCGSEKRETPKWKARRRPEYCKKRTPVRKAMNQRSNLRKIRW